MMMEALPLITCLLLYDDPASLYRHEDRPAGSALWGLRALIARSRHIPRGQRA